MLIDSMAVATHADESDAVLPAVVFDQVSFAFDDHVVLRDVSFTLPTGGMTILLGASGSGKSVLLKLILGFLRPDTGTIVVHGERIDRMSEPDLMRMRGDIGMLFQNSALFDSLTVAENVGYRLAEESRLPDREIRRRVEEVLGFIGLHDYTDRMPSELSGDSVAASRSRARWPQNQRWCFLTIRRPGSIRSLRRRSTTKSSSSAIWSRSPRLS